MKSTSQSSLKYLAISYELLAEIQISLGDSLEAIKLFQKACPLLNLFVVKESFGGTSEPINKRCIRVLQYICNSDPDLSEHCLGVEDTVVEYNNWKADIESKATTRSLNQMNSHLSPSSEEGQSSSTDQAFKAAVDVERDFEVQKATKVHKTDIRLAYLFI